MRRAGSVRYRGRRVPVWYAAQDEIDAAMRASGQRKRRDELWCGYYDPEEKRIVLFERHHGPEGRRYLWHEVLEMLKYEAGLRLSHATLDALSVELAELEATVGVFP